MVKPDNKEGWANFRSKVQLVLKALSTIEVTVPAGAASAAAAALEGLAADKSSNGARAGDVMQIANGSSSRSSGSGAQGEGEDSQQLTVGYLSSHKLFGLQLRDAMFRRNFLVQVLIMLQSLTVAGKGQDVVLKGQQATEAEELQKEVGDWGGLCCMLQGSLGSMMPANMLTFVKRDHCTALRPCSTQA